MQRWNSWVPKTWKSANSFALFVTIHLPFLCDERLRTMTDDDEQRRTTTNQKKYHQRRTRGNPCPHSKNSHSSYRATLDVPFLLLHCIVRDIRGMYVPGGWEGIHAWFWIILAYHALLGDHTGWVHWGGGGLALVNHSTKHRTIACQVWWGTSPHATLPKYD